MRKSTQTASPPPISSSATSSSPSSSSSSSDSIPISTPLSLPPSHSASDHCHAILAQLQQLVIDAAPPRMIRIPIPHQHRDPESNHSPPPRRPRPSFPVPPRAFEHRTLVKQDSPTPRGNHTKLPKALQHYFKCTQNMERLVKECMQILDKAMKSGEEEGDGCAFVCQWMKDRYDPGKTDACMASSAVATSSSCSSSIPFGFPSSASSASASASPSAFDPELNPAINHVQLQWRRLNCLSALSTYSLNANESNGTRRNTKCQSETHNDHNGHDEQQATDRGMNNVSPSDMASSGSNSTTTTTSSISTSSSSPSHIPFGLVWLTLALLLPLALQRRMLPMESVDLMQRTIQQLLHPYASNRESVTIRRLFGFTDHAASGMWDEADFIYLCSISLAILVTDDERSRPGSGIRRFSPPSTPQQQEIAASAMHSVLNLLIDILSFTQYNGDGNGNGNGNGRGTGTGKQFQHNNGNAAAAVLVQAGREAEQVTSTDAVTVKGRDDDSHANQKRHSRSRCMKRPTERMMEAVQICMEQIQCLLFYLSPFSSSLSPLIGRAYYRLGICCRSYSYGEWSGTPSPLLGLFSLNADCYSSDGRSLIHMRPILMAMLEASEEEIEVLPIEHAVRWIQLLGHNSADINTASELLYERLLLTLMAWQKKRKEKHRQQQQEMIQMSESRVEGSDSAPHIAATTASNSSSTIPFDANGAATAAATSAAIHDLTDRSVYNWGEIHVPTHLHIWLRCLLDALPRLLVSRDILHAFYPIIIPRKRYTEIPQSDRRRSHPNGLHALLRALDQPAMHKHINIYEHIGTSYLNADLSILTALFCLPQSSIDLLTTHSNRLLTCVGIRHPLSDSLRRLLCYENALLSLTAYSLPHRHHRWRYDWLEALFGLIRDFDVESDKKYRVHQTAPILQQLHEKQYFAIDPEKDRERAEDWLYFMRWLDDYSFTHPDAPFFRLRHMVTQQLRLTDCSLSFPRWWLIDQCQFSMDTDWLLFFFRAPYHTYQKDEDVAYVPNCIRRRKRQEKEGERELNRLREEAAKWWYANGIKQIRSALNLHLIPDLTGLVMEYALYPCMRDPHAPPPNHQTVRVKSVVSSAHL